MPNGTQTQTAFEFLALPEGWTRLLGLVLAVGIVYGVFWLYSREGRVGASPRLRMGLAILRCVILAVLIVILLNPVWVTFIEQTTPARVVVLIDRSASMLLDDQPTAEGEPRQSRTAVIDQLLEAEQGEFFTKLAEKNELWIYDFAGRAIARVNDPNANLADQQVASPLPDRTNLGEALTQALDDRGTQPLAAIVMISDGVITEGSTSEELAPLVRSAEAPVYAIGVGQDQEPPNLRVAGITAPSIAPKGDPFELRIDLEARGVTAESIEVVVDEIPLDGSTSERVLAKQTIEIGPDGAIAPLLIPVSSDREGELLYRVQLPQVDGELLPDDNTRSTAVRILDDQLRVLLVAGRPSYEYRHLTTLFERDDTIELSVWLQSADQTALRDGDRVITQLPREPSELFAYDLIMLHDPDPDGLDSSWAITVRRFVDEFGGGLLYQAGVQHAQQFLNEPRLADLISILPIVARDDITASMRGAASRSQAKSLTLPAVSDTHPLVRLNTDPQINRRIWNALPRMWWTLPIRRSKPIASTLLNFGEAGERSPIALATQPYGAGRVGYLGVESTWRWRSTAERYYTQFWVQMVRYLCSARRQSTSDRGSIVLETDQLAVGDPLNVEVRLLDEDFLPWHASEITGEVEQESVTRPFTLRAIPGRDGWYSARVLIESEGVGQIRIPLPSSSDEFLVQRFRATSPDQEWERLALDRTSLNALAQASGGRLLSLAEARAVPELIPSKLRTRVQRGDERPIWDRAWVLWVLAGLLATEWAVRRSHHLL
jgi:hypothetical protein